MPAVRRNRRVSSDPVSLDHERFARLRSADIEAAPGGLPADTCFPSPRPSRRPVDGPPSSRPGDLLAACTSDDDEAWTVTRATRHDHQRRWRPLASYPGKSPDRRAARDTALQWPSDAGGVRRYLDDRALRTRDQRPMPRRSSSPTLLSRAFSARWIARFVGTELQHPRVPDAQTSCTRSVHRRARQPRWEDECVYTDAAQGVPPRQTAGHDSTVCAAVAPPPPRVATVPRPENRSRSAAAPHEIATVVAISPCLSAAATGRDTEEPVRPPRDPLPSARERVVRVGLDREVHMADLRRVLHDAEVRTRVSRIAVPEASTSGCWRNDAPPHARWRDDPAAPRAVSPGGTRLLSGLAITSLPLGERALLHGPYLPDKRSDVSRRPRNPGRPAGLVSGARSADIAGTHPRRQHPVRKPPPPENLSLPRHRPTT